MGRLFKFHFSLFSLKMVQEEAETRKSHSAEKPHYSLSRGVGKVGGAQGAVMFSFDMNKRANPS